MIVLTVADYHQHSHYNGAFCKGFIQGYKGFRGSGHGFLVLKIRGEGLGFKICGNLWVSGLSESRLQRELLL